jgi:hypothetical protein
VGIKMNGRVQADWRLLLFFCVHTAQGVISRACRAARARLVLLCEWVSERRHRVCMHAGFVATRDELQREVCASPTAAQLSNYNKQCVVGIIATSQQPFVQE